MPASVFVGTVKYYDESRGYGFVKPNNGGRDAFIHHTVLVLSGIGVLSAGERLLFECEPERRGKGPKIVRVKRLGHHNNSDE